MTTTPQSAPAFTVHDRSTLEWYVRQIAAKQAEMEAVRVQSGAMLRDLNREIEQLEFLYGAQAQTVLERLLDEQRGQRRHVKTLWGNIGFRATPARVTVRDAARTLAWASLHAPDLLETSVNRLALTRRFTATPDGALVDQDGAALEIPGVTVSPAEQRLYIKTPGAASSADDLA